MVGLPRVLEQSLREARVALPSAHDAKALQQAVARTGGRALLEASGGITPDTLRAVAATGVDRISIGKLTKDVQAVDYSLRVLERIR